MTQKTRKDFEISQTVNRKVIIFVDFCVFSVDKNIKKW